MGQLPEKPRSRRNRLIAVGVVAAYVALWLVTQLLGASAVRRDIRVAEAARSGGDIPEQSIGAWAPAPFLVLGQKPMLFRATDLASGRVTVRAFRITSLHFWIGKSFTLKEELRASEVPNLPTSR
jgi:hypothetical protein